MQSVFIQEQTQLFSGKFSHSHKRLEMQELSQDLQLCAVLDL